MTQDRAAEEEALAIGARLAAIYSDVYVRAMRDVPICNAALEVEAIGFRPYGALALGIVVTPWFMNLVLAPRKEGALPDAAHGATRAVSLPAGRVDFITGVLDGFGPIWTCSLFSPMSEFLDHAAASATAEASLEELLAAPAIVDPPAAQAGLDRRALLRGGRLRETSP